MSRPVGVLARDGLARAYIHTFRHLLHADAMIDRADTHTQVATHALFINDLEVALAIHR